MIQQQILDPVDPEVLKELEHIEKLLKDLPANLLELVERRDHLMHGIRPRPLSAGDVF